MRHVKDSELEMMSVRDLLDLQAALQTAIRAAIRRKAEEKSASARPEAAVAAAPVQRADLERERDAWLAARRRGGA